MNAGQTARVLVVQVSAKVMAAERVAALMLLLLIKYQMVGVVQVSGQGSSPAPCFLLVSINYALLLICNR